MIKQVLQEVNQLSSHSEFLDFRIKENITIENDTASGFLPPPGSISATFKAKAFPLGGRRQGRDQSLLNQPRTEKSAHIQYLRQLRDTFRDLVYADDIEERRDHRSGGNFLLRWRRARNHRPAGEKSAQAYARPARFYRMTGDL